MIARVVEYDDDPAAELLAAQQALQEPEEGDGVEDRGHHASELAGPQADRTETGHRLSGRGMLQNRVLDLRRDPHSAPRTMLLEMTFIQAPEFDVGAFC